MINDYWVDEDYQIEQGMSSVAGSHGMLSVCRSQGLNILQDNTNAITQNDKALARGGALAVLPIRPALHEQLRTKIDELPLAGAARMEQNLFSDFGGRGFAFVADASTLSPNWITGGLSSGYSIEDGATFDILGHGLMALALPGVSAPKLTLEIYDQILVTGQPTSLPVHTISDIVGVAVGNPNIFELPEGASKFGQVYLFPMVLEPALSILTDIAGNTVTWRAILCQTGKFTNYDHIHQIEVDMVT